MSSRHSDFWAVGKFCVLSIDFWLQRSFFICSLSPVPKNDNKPSRIVTRLAFSDFCEHFCSCLSCEIGQQVLQTQRRNFRSYLIEYFQACLAFFVYPPTELTLPSWYVSSMGNGSSMLQRFKKKNTKVQIWMCVCGSHSEQIATNLLQQLLQENRASEGDCDVSSLAYWVFVST